MTKNERERERRRKKFKEEWKPAYDAFIPLYPLTIENLPGEMWLPIPYCNDYHMSNFGRVKSFKNGNEIILKPQLTQNGYLIVQLCKDGKHKNFSVNVLVGTLFIPNPDNKPEVNHIYSRFSNHIDCLEWATSSENVHHAVHTGLIKSGEESYRAKLTAAQILYIRENPDGLNTIQLAEMFGVNHQAISKIQLGKKWKNAGGTIRESKMQHVSDDKRAQIIADYQKGVRGHGYTSVGKRFGVDEKTVRRIVNGR